MQGQRVKRCPKEEEAGVKNLGDNKQAGRGRRVDWQRACFLCGATLGGEVEAAGRGLWEIVHQPMPRGPTSNYPIYLCFSSKGWLYSDNLYQRRVQLLLFLFLFFFGLGGPHNGSADV